ncbi:hypothetical protein WJX72_002740 [[Myrmecia] bisecta]|uniref:Uncharacterized protein n=1 Tax=[Myrmecia] bisecta TaxID=41462 RepID=A0AAW1Q8F0_9CHLO
MCQGVALFYKQTLNVDKLKQAICKGLAINPLMAGRLKTVDQKLVLELNNAGVPISEVKLTAATTDFGPQSSVRSNVAPDDLPVYLEAIDCKKVLAGTEPLAKFRVCHLRDGGSIFSVTFNHALCDGAAMVNMGIVLRELLNHPDTSCEMHMPWDRTLLSQHNVKPGTLPGFSTQEEAALYELQQRSTNHLFLPWKRLASLKILGRVIGQHLKDKRMFPGKNMSQESVHIPAADISTLKAQLQALLPKGSVLLSTNDVICALIWHVTCGVRNRPLPGERARRHGRITMPLDLRDAYLPKDYFGNGYTSYSIPGGNQSLTEPNRGAQQDPVAQFCTESLDLSSCPGLNTQVVELAATAARLRTGLVVARNPAVIAEQLATKSRLMELPWKTQLQHLAAMLADTDLIATSWTRFPFGELDLDASGKPFAVSLSATPLAAWRFAIVAAPQGGFDINCSIPAAASGKMKAHPLWALAVPNHRFY